VVFSATLSGVGATLTPESNGPASTPAVPAATEAGDHAAQLGPGAPGAPSVTAPKKGSNPDRIALPETKFGDERTFAGFFFGVAAVISFGLLVGALMRGYRAVFETHWGGIGGGMSGISFSPALLYVLLTVFFSLLIIIVLMSGFGFSPTAGGTTTPPGQTHVPNAATK